MWDFNVSRVHLTICYPDGLTTISTANLNIVNRFLKEIGDVVNTENEKELDNLLEAYAMMMVAKGCPAKRDQYAMGSV